MEKGSTPASVLFPWFPSAARKRKNAATNDLYLLLKKHLDARQEEGRREEDAVQVLIDEGDGVNDIVQVWLVPSFFPPWYDLIHLNILVCHGRIVRWN